MRMPQLHSGSYPMEGTENNVSLGSHEEEGVAGNDDAAYMAGWFSMNRKDGGPTFYPDFPISYPSILDSSDIIICCFVFSVPLVSFIILLPSFRKKHLSSVLVVILALLSGLGTTCAYVSSSWLVGEAEVVMPVGPSGKPVKSLVGLWAGLWHLNLTYLTPDMYVNHMVTWVDRSGMMAAHKSSLADGWPLALVSLTAELSGEGIAWRGLLGDGIFHAGSVASYSLIAALYSWCIWIVTFVIAPEMTIQLLMITGMFLGLSALVYIGWGLFYFPANVLVGGILIKLKLGWAWWLIGCMSILLAVVGGIFLAYDYTYPGRLCAMFKVDFYTQTDDLSGAQETLFAYESPAETYSQIYPLSLSYLWYGNKNSSTQSLINKANSELTVEDCGDMKFTVKDGTASEDGNSGANINPTVKYVNEVETESDHTTILKESVNAEPDTVIKGNSPHVVQRPEEQTTLRRRTPPEKSPSRKKSSSEPTLTVEEPSYATIRKGKTMPRQLSVPTVVPQISPRSSGLSYKRSFSRIHSKFRPKHSPRKPSMVSLISIPRLELEEINENVTHL